MDIKEALRKAENRQSKIPQSYFENMTGGLSSELIWHLLNNLAAQSKNYLELGSYMGSTLLAALYDNQIYAVAIDNFCMKPTAKDYFYQNTKKLDFQFFEQDAFKVNLKEIIEPIELFFIDGEHTYEAQYRALEYFYPVLSDEFVVVVDDWVNKPVQKGTMDAIKDLGLQIIECEIRDDKKMKDKNGWWCGISIFKLRKR
jgi:predicted O-methyltransferase YrrM